MNDIERVWPIIAPYGWCQWGAKRGNCFRGGSLRSAASLERAVLQLCGQGFDLYLGLNPARPKGIKARRAEVLEFRQLLLDIDPVADDYDASLALTRALAIASDVLVASGGHGNVGESAIIIDSGRGMQAWLQFEPIVLEDELHRIEVEYVCSSYLNRISQEMGTYQGCRIDTRTSDLPRIGRCPMSINSKTGRVASILQMACASLRTLPTITQASFTTHDSRPTVVYRQGVHSWKDILPRLAPLAMDFLCYGVLEPGRHAAGYHTAIELAKVGLPEEAAIEWVSDGLALCRPSLSHEEAPRIVRNAYRRFLETDRV